MVVYTLLVCPYVSCSNAKDAIQITMKEDNSADYSKILFKLGTDSGTNERKWKRQDILFETETSRISVLNFWKYFNSNNNFSKHDQNIF